MFLFKKQTVHRLMLHYINYIDFNWEPDIALYKIEKRL